jgi:two-component system CheB/CheR fusion protein
MGTKRQPPHEPTTGKEAPRSRKKRRAAAKTATAHKRNLESLAKAHHDVEHLLASTDFGIILLDRDFRVRRFTPAVRPIVELHDTDVGRPITDIAFDLEYDRLVLDIKEVLITLAPRKFEIQAKNECWYRVRIRPYRTADDVIEGVLVTLVDVTDLKTGQQQLRLFTEAVEQSPNSILLTDAEGRIEYVNPYFTELTGYTREEALGQRPNLLKSGQHPEALYQELWQTLKAGRIWRGELRNKKKDGTLYDDEVVISPIKDERGIITRFLSIQTDITERKCAEAREHQQREVLSHMGRISTMGEIATNLAHELNQPLAAIVTYTEGIAQQVQSGKPLDTASLAALSETADLARRATGIVRSIREVISKHDVVQQRVDINEVVRQAVEIRTAKALSEGASVTLDLQPDLPTLEGKFIQLEHVMINLICNAIEAMEEVARNERALTVRTFTNPRREIEVMVQDTGPGVPGDMARRMFDAFVTTKPDGLGIGLAICRTIVEAHGGQIWARTVPPRGTVIHLTLPIGVPGDEPIE